MTEEKVMVSGWLEMKHTHFHGGDEVSLPFVLSEGHEGGVQPKYNSLKAVGPEGQTIMAEYKPGETGGTVHFATENDGIYRVCLGMETNTATLYAQALVAVGHHISGDVPQLGCPLEIHSPKWHSWQTGDTVGFRLLREGVPVSDRTLHFVNHTFDGEVTTAKTREDGWVEIAFDKPGSYVCTVAPDKDRGSAISASLHFMVMKKR